MLPKSTMATIAVTIILALAGPLIAEESFNTQWNLTDMFADEAAFLIARESVTERIPDIEKCRGTLGESADQMRRCLELRYDARREYIKLAVYASLNSDRDLRNAAGQQLKSETQRVGVELGAATSWFRPEILELGADTIQAFITEEPDLEPYGMFLRDTLRGAEHTLPSDQEQLLAQVGLISGKFSDVYRQLTVSDMPYPAVDLPGVGEITLDQSAYVKYRGSNDADLRHQVFNEFWTTYNNYQSTLGTLLGAEVQKNWFYAKSRQYSSSVEAALDRNNIPVDVYTALIRDVRANLPVLHRMLDLRKRILGLETLGYPDIYASIVPSVDVSYTWEEAQPIVLDALSPLGENYVTTVTQGFDSWFDVYPAEGKRGGAYSSGSWYDGHPWILLNYNDSYDSVSTTAHELGHAMHSRLSNHTQPYPTAGYSIMAAEVSSTFNEALLKEKLLSEQTDPKLRMLILGNFLERFRQTVFRQTMFADFELETHRRVEAGEALTGESLSTIYIDLLRQYHGHDLGVMEIDDLYSVEWAFIPHFYRGFYVYQYSTGMVASTALAEKVLAGEPGATERYIEFLSAGGSDYPIALLKKAGVDLTTSEPFETAIQAVNRAMDEIEELIPLVYPHD